MTLADLRDAGIDALLRKAAEALRQNGLAKGVTIDPSTFGLSVRGALARAAGARVRPLLHLLDDDPIAAVPQGNQHRYYEAVVALEASLGDLDAWSDQIESTEAQRKLNDLADRIAIAVG